MNRLTALIPILLMIAACGQKTPMEPEPEGLRVWFESVPAERYSRSIDSFLAFEVHATADPADSITITLFADLIDWIPLDQKTYDPGILAGQRYYLSRTILFPLVAIANTPHQLADTALFNPNSRQSYQ